MARYIITYRRPGNPTETYEIGAKSDGEARIRFLNLGWVVFTEIAIERVEPKGPEDVAPALPARPAASSSGGDPRPVAATTRAARAAADKDWRAACDALTEDIGRLADEAQADERAGRHDAADQKRRRAKDLAAQRAAITKRKKGK